MIKEIFSYVILIFGIFFAFRFIKKGIDNKENLEKKKFLKYSIAEFLVFFFAAMGFPDFLLNMPIYKKFKWVEDERIPETLMSASIVPSSVIAFLYLINSKSPDMRTLIPCLIAIIIGSYIGAGFVLKIDGKKMSNIMLIALIFSIFSLLARLIISRGVTGIDESLVLSKILIAVPLVFIFGFMNPFGVPMKPPSTALFLLLGLSPVTTLTNMLVLGSGSTISSCLRIIKSKRYNLELTIASVIFGTIGGILGYKLAISLNQVVLTIILLVIILISIIQNITKRSN